MKPFLPILFSSFLLTSCASTNDVHATCPLLKSNLVFSGATSNVRNAEIQDAEVHLQQADYDQHCIE